MKEPHSFFWKPFTPNDHLKPILLFFFLVHCGSLRQTATIVRMDKEHLRTGDKASCRFRFIKCPEFICPGTKMIFREGRTKAVGTITKLHEEVSGKSTHNTRQNKQYKALMHQRGKGASNRRNVTKNGPRHPPQAPVAAPAVAT